MIQEAKEREVSQNHGFQPYKYTPNLLVPPKVDNTPLARVVMQRDPVRTQRFHVCTHRISDVTCQVPHVPAGDGELPTGLNVLRVEQKPNSDVVVLESEGPHAGEGAHTDGVSVPVQVGDNSYVHLGHQWVSEHCMSPFSTPSALCLGYGWKEAIGKVAQPIRQIFGRYMGCIQRLRDA